MFNRKPTVEELRKTAEKNKEKYKKKQIKIILKTINKLSKEGQSEMILQPNNLEDGVIDFIEQCGFNIERIYNPYMSTEVKHYVIKWGE